MSNSKLFSTLSFIIGVITALMGLVFSNILIVTGIIWALISLISFFSKERGGNVEINFAELDEESKRLKEDAKRTDKAIERLSKIKYK